MNDTSRRKFSIKRLDIVHAQAKSRILGNRRVTAFPKMDFQPIPLHAGIIAYIEKRVKTEFLLIKSDRVLDILRR